DVLDLRRLVPLEVDDDLVLAGLEAEEPGRVAATAEIPAIDVHRRSGRVRLHVDDGDVGPDARERLLDRGPARSVRLLLERLNVVAERVRVLLERLVRSSDVEDDVAVRHEPVRHQEVLKGAPVIALSVTLRGDPEV